MRSLRPRNDVPSTSCCCCRKLIDTTALTTNLNTETASNAAHHIKPRRASRRLSRENREAIEAERSARRRAKDRAEAARAERKAKALAQKEMQRRNQALDRQEEEAR